MEDIERLLADTQESLREHMALVKEAQAERDEARAALVVEQRWRDEARTQRDEYADQRDRALALLRECRDYIRDERQPHPNSPVGQLLARLDEVLR